MHYRRMLVLMLVALTTMGGTRVFAHGATKPVVRRLSAVTTSEMVQEAVSLKRTINFYRRATWKWQDAALVARTPSSYGERRTKSLPYLRWIAGYWSGNASRSRRIARNPPHLAMWMCIHGKEASWWDHASHNPHYGGLQLGMWFMQTYAPGLLHRFGTADQWTPITQIWVAEHAYAREGYSKNWLYGQWSTAYGCI